MHRYVFIYLFIYLIDRTSVAVTRAFFFLKRWGDCLEKSDSFL